MMRSSNNAIDTVDAGMLDDRPALARALIAKAVLNLPTTAALIERPAVDVTPRRLCGWERGKWRANANIKAEARAQGKAGFPKAVEH